MEWLTQNWLVLVVGIAASLLMRRWGMCCGPHGGHQRGSTPDKPPGELDGKAAGVPNDPR
ncbi:MAG: hypothetical protein ABI478_15105 [Propionivibrio sp.]